MARSQSNFTLFLFLGILAVLGIGGIAKCARQSSLGPFKAVAKDLAGSAKLPEAAYLDYPADAPPLAGPILIVDLGKRPRPDVATLALPESLRPKKDSPRNLGSVVFLSREYVVTGSYGDGTKARTERVRLWVQALPDRTLLAATSLDGAAPPFSKRSGDSGDGRPVEAKAIVAWLTALGRP